MNILSGMVFILDMVWPHTAHILVGVSSNYFFCWMVRA
jgi:hypothetical protein